MSWFNKKIAMWDYVDIQQHNDIEVFTQILRMKDFLRDDIKKLEKDYIFYVQVIRNNDPDSLPNYVINDNVFSFDKNDRLIDIAPWWSISTKKTKSKNFEALSKVKDSRALEKQYVNLRLVCASQQQDIDIFIQLIRMKDYRLDDFKTLQTGTFTPGAYSINRYIFSFDEAGKLTEIALSDEACDASIDSPDYIR